MHAHEPALTVLPDASLRVTHETTDSDPPAAHLADSDPPAAHLADSDPPAAHTADASPTAAHADDATRSAHHAPATPLGAQLLGGDDAHVAPSLAREATRFACGLGLASIYGLAIGAREGGVALLDNALGAPSALLAVGALGVPSFAIVLALMNAPVDGMRLAAVTSRATATSGLVLAGLAPAAALFALTSSTRDAATLTALLGLWVAGALGLGRLLVGLRAALSGADSATRTLGTVVSAGFGLFAIALAARLWSSALPALSGGAQ